MRERFAIVELRWSEAWKDSSPQWESVFVGGGWQTVHHTDWSDDGKFVQVHFNNGTSVNDPVWAFSAFKVPTTNAIVVPPKKKHSKATKIANDKKIREAMQSAKGQSNNNYSRKGK